MQLPYIDDRRIVLYGKVSASFQLPHRSAERDLSLASRCFSLQGFGGYLTLKMSAATEKLFQCSVAVAPITDFRLYSEWRPCLL